MLSEIGNLSVLISIFLSIFLILLSINELKSVNQISLKIKNISIMQLLFTNLSFIILMLGYLMSDFSLINVYDQLLLGPYAIKNSKGIKNGAKTIL